MANARASRPVDKHVGERIRMRRIMCEMTQVELGYELGITFQQVQKYETGANRIGASRLYHTAQILDVPPGFFFEDISGSKSRAGTSGLPDYLVDVMGTALGKRLVQALARVPDTRMRTSLVQLIEGMANQHSEPKRRKSK
jgi:transcriptional regulator with XRE-family HTH domain